MDGNTIHHLASQFANNRRDGARLISSAVAVHTIALTQLDYSWGKALSVISFVISVRWGLVYRSLGR